MNDRANMRPFIYRNSGIEALEREIQQLKNVTEAAIAYVKSDINDMNSVDCTFERLQAEVERYEEAGRK